MVEASARMLLAYQEEKIHEQDPNKRVNPKSDEVTPANSERPVVTLIVYSC